MIRYQKAFQQMVINYRIDRRETDRGAEEDRQVYSPYMNCLLVALVLFRSGEYEVAGLTNQSAASGSQGPAQGALSPWLEDVLDDFQISLTLG